MVVTVIVPALALGSAHSSLTLPVAESSWALSSADDTGKSLCVSLLPSPWWGLGADECALCPLSLYLQTPLRIWCPPPPHLAVSAGAGGGRVLAAPHPILSTWRRGGLGCWASGRGQEDDSARPLEDHSRGCTWFVEGRSTGSTHGFGRCQLLHVEEAPTFLKRV